MKIDKGTKALIADLEEILTEARNGEFGDFTNEKYAAPKMALMDKINIVRDNIISGKYDG